LLEPVLKRTLGVPLFQEQLLRIAMIAANFTGGEAEDLRRAMGFKRSQARMREIEAKLRAGMTANGISPKAQEEIILSITSFALYGFPESHAASFALIAYASAYLKCHYLAAFTAALLNNQPMGFYSPATIVKDAQRHGLKLLPVDVTKSEWNCTLELVASSEYRVPSGEVVGRSSLVVSPENSNTSAAQRRQNTAHGASRGTAEEIERRAPQGRKNTENGNHIETSESPYSQPGTRYLQRDQSRKERNVKARGGSPGEGREDWYESRRDGTFQSIINNPQSTISEIGNRQSKIENPPALRMGLRYVRGLREEAARSLLLERIRAPFTSIHDLTRRVPELRRDELTTLAEIGALNAIGSQIEDFRFQISKPVQSEIYNLQSKISSHLPSSPAFNNQNSTINNSRHTVPGTRYSSLHRRDALWQVERAVRPSGPLLEQHAEPDEHSPLAPMNQEERLVADFHGTGLTVGPHPMAYKRAWLSAMGIRRASELRNLSTGKRLRIGGCVITRQRPGTAKGFVFLSLEDETGVANAIVRPDLFHENRLLLTSERFLAIEGILQNQDNVISVRAERVQPLFVTKAETSSHDFH
jgi:DNA polymerase III alpha subunit